MNTNIMPPGWELTAFYEQALAEARSRHREQLASADDAGREKLEKQIRDEVEAVVKARFPHETLEHMSALNVRW